MVRYEPPEGLMSCPACEALSADLRALVLIIAEGCDRRRDTGAITGAPGLYIQQRAAVLEIPTMACWCGLVLLTVDGLATAEEHPPGDVVFGLPPRRLPPVSPAALIARRVAMPVAVDAALRGACLVADLDPRDPRVREALLFGVLGVLNRL